jgi:uncharacterized membrane-anchored protein
MQVRGYQMNAVLVTGLTLVVLIAICALLLNRRQNDAAGTSDVHETKVPEVTLGFWLMKIFATTLGETGGDSVTMTWLKADIMVNAGYLIGSAIFLSALIVFLVLQISSKKFHPFLYWSVIVASTTAGTAMADFATRISGHWLHWRIVAAVRVPNGGAGRLVLVRGVNLG